MSGLGHRSPVSSPERGWTWPLRDPPPVSSSRPGWSVLRLLHHLHYHHPGSGEDQVADGAVVQVQDVQPVDGNHKLTNLREGGRRTFNTSRDSSTPRLAFPRMPTFNPAAAAGPQGSTAWMWHGRPPLTTNPQPTASPTICNQDGGKSLFLKKTTSAG